MKQSTRRLFAYGSNASLVTVLVLMALAGLYMLAENKRVRLDMSEDGQNTLAVETVEKIRLLAIGPDREQRAEVVGGERLSVDGAVEHDLGKLASQQPRPHSLAQDRACLNARWW